MVKIFWLATRRPRQSALTRARGIDNFTDIRAFINKQTSSTRCSGRRQSYRAHGTDAAGLASNIKSNLLLGFLVDGVGDALTPATTTSIIDIFQREKVGHKCGSGQAIRQSYYFYQSAYHKYDADFIIILVKTRFSQHVNQSTTGSQQ